MKTTQITQKGISAFVRQAKDSMKNRIIIIGKPGSGKSTAAAKLSKKLGIPVYHIDKIFFTHNWEKRNIQEFLQLKQQWIDQDNWIIEGQATRWLEARFSRATLCIHFELPFWLCLWRIFKRRFFCKDTTIQDRAPKCKEVIRWDLLHYTWNYEKRGGKRVKEAHKKYPNVPFYTVRSDKEVQKLITKLF